MILYIHHYVIASKNSEPAFFRAFMRFNCDRYFLCLVCEEVVRFETFEFADGTCSAAYAAGTMELIAYAESKANHKKQPAPVFSDTIGTFGREEVPKDNYRLI
ncbi:hypothetical protein [Paenibacillus ehimensis]|uniref:hypothetical protein n=1 Tax=Paenibacillus ehimensis TaxID=79264 RepID=UPI000FDB764E|nr:hypothetical protein [Paenibacillus ehimensis]